MNNWYKQHLDVPVQVIRRANLEKSYGHQLFSGRRNPSRDTVLLLAFVMEAGLAQAQEMLRIVGRSRSITASSALRGIIYCLHNHISLIDTQIILQDLIHPGLLHYYELFRNDQMICIVREYIDVEPLHSNIRERHFTLDDIVSLSVKLCGISAAFVIRRRTDSLNILSPSFPSTILSYLSLDRSRKLQKTGFR